MSTMTSRRQKNVTLKQYLISNSLKKRVTSRANSKQSKQSPNQTHTKPQPIQMLGRNSLVDQIKLFLAQNIQPQSKLAKILKMFDRLIQLFNRQIYDKNCQFELLGTMIHEKPMVTRMQYKNTGEKLANKKLYTQPVQILSNNNGQMSQKRERKNSIIEIYNYVRESRSSNNEQVPNIHVLLQTRNHFKDLQTQQTINNDKESYLNQSKISIQLDYDFTDHSLLTSNKFNLTKKPKTTQFNSLNSSFSKASQGSALSRFQQMKRRLEK